MMKEQDQGLEMLGQSAERLSKISMGIHEELGHQNKWVLQVVFAHDLYFQIGLCMLWINQLRDEGI